MKAAQTSAFVVLPDLWRAHRASKPTTRRVLITVAMLAVSFITLPEGALRAINHDRFRFAKARAARKSGVDFALAIGYWIRVQATRKRYTRRATTKKLHELPGRTGKRWESYLAPSSSGFLIAASQPCTANSLRGSSVPNRQPIPCSSIALSACCIHGLVSNDRLTRSVTSTLRGAARRETSTNMRFTADSSR